MNTAAKDPAASPSQSLLLLLLRREIGFDRPILFDDPLFAAPKAVAKFRRKKHEDIVSARAWVLPYLRACEAKYLNAVRR